MSEQERPWSVGRAAAVVALASLCFSTSGPLARVAAPAHPLLIAAGRTALAAALLGALAPGETWRAWRGLRPRTRLQVAGAGAILAAHFGCFLAGLATTSFAAAVTLVSLEPVAVVLVAWAAFGSRPRAGEWLGVGLATAGALAVASSGSQEHKLLGDALVLVAVALYGLYLGAARGLAGALPPRPYAASVYAAAGASLLVVCAALGLGDQALALPPTSLGAIAALAVIPTLGGHTLVQWAARHVPATVVALVSPGETVGSLLIGAVLLEQAPSASEGVGALLVLAGVGCTLVAQRAG